MELDFENVLPSQSAPNLGDETASNDDSQSLAEKFIKAIDNYMLELTKEHQKQIIKLQASNHTDSLTNLNNVISNIIERKRNSLFNELIKKKEELKKSLSNTQTDLYKQIDIDHFLKSIKKRVQIYETKYLSIISMERKNLNKINSSLDQYGIDSDDRENEKYTDFMSDTEICVAGKYFDSNKNRIIKKFTKFNSEINFRNLIEKFEQTSLKKTFKNESQKFLSDTELDKMLWFNDLSLNNETKQPSKKRRKLRSKKRKYSSSNHQNNNILVDNIITLDSDSNENITVTNPIEIDSNTLESTNKQISDNSSDIEETAVLNFNGPLNFYKENLSEKRLKSSSSSSGDDENEYVLLDSNESNDETTNKREQNLANKRKLKICSGLKVLALSDPLKHIWKTATIYRIKKLDNESYQENCLKIVSNSKYVVKFEHQVHEPAVINDIPEYENDLISIQEISDEDDDTPFTDDSIQTIDDNIEIIQTKKGEDTITKRKTQTNQEPIKKRKLKQIKPSHRDDVELDSTCVAYLPISDKNILPDLPYIGYDNGSNTMILPIRSRVVSFYSLFIDSPTHNSKLLDNQYLCSATIVELPSAKNLNRYLVFFDNGFVSYVSPKHAYPIFNLFKSPIDRLDFDHIYFVQNYFENYPERAMVRLTINDIVTICVNHKWHQSKVIEVDASLVKLELDIKMFDSFNDYANTNTVLNSHMIWLFRGSYKLLPLYEVIMNKIAESQADDAIVLNDYENFIKEKQKDFVFNQNKLLSMFASTSFPNSGPSYFKTKIEKRNREKEEQRVIQGQLKLLDLENSMRDIIFDFKPHPCTNNCVARWENNIGIVKSVNPLLMPGMHGWQRHICHQSKTLNTGSKKWVNYMAPCGRILRSTGEVDRYLYLTNSNLTIDMFSFDFYIHTDREFEANAKFVNVYDITEGKETVPISCVNCVDLNKPENVDYSSKRIALDGVPLDTNIDLMEGCQCEDNCRDRSKCGCWRKTFEATTFNADNKMNTNIGYRGRRLPEMVNTGIFECNPKCKCDHRCSNRVAQNGVSLRLQLFKTTSKGWGLRCLDDIPKGHFICTYSGHLMTEEQSDIRGVENGDEYFAELDFVECLRRLKAGFVLLSDNDTDSDNSNSNEISRNRTNHQRILRKNPMSITQNTEIDFIVLDSDEDEQDRTERTEPNQQEKDLELKLAQRREERKRDVASLIISNGFFTNQSNRFFYEDFLNDARIYIMDAKICGNIGRYFNHSCSPNVFVQNIFVDTYDLRFPWISFFALNSIKAGTELSWDYNYTIGSVKGKELFCCCNSSNCRGRLL